MASSIWLSSAGTNYFLSGAGKSYNGGGTPWTVQADSPYQIAMNTTSGQSWTPLAAQRQEVYGGGPPLRDGQELVYNSYGNVTEQLVIQCRGTSHNTALTLLHQLRRILNTTKYSVPCVLAVQPNGATNAVYYEIYGADVQEDERFINEEAKAAASGTAVIRAIVTWRRSPFGGPTGYTTLFTNSSFTNNGTNNLVAFPALAGDFIQDGGQPLNLTIDGPNASSTNVNKLWLSTALDRIKTTHSAASGNTTTSVAWGSAATTIDISLILGRAGLFVCPFIRFSSTTSANKAQFRLYIRGDNTGAVVSGPTPWINFPVSSGTTMLYCGAFGLEFLRAPATSSVIINYAFEIRSTDGTTVAATVDYSETVLAYTVCETTASTVIYGTGGGQMYLSSAKNLAGSVQPNAPPHVYSTLTAPKPQYAEQVRGELPRGISNGNLWAAWLNDTNNHTTTDVLRITANHAPLYRTIRGSA